MGNADVGKSTLLGVLSQGDLDNGRGKARLNMFRHLHEIQTGRTSSISHEVLGFDASGKVSLFNVFKSVSIITVPYISITVSIIYVLFSDICQDVFSEFVLALSRKAWVSQPLENIKIEIYSMFLSKWITNNSSLENCTWRYQYIKPSFTCQELNYSGATIEEICGSATKLITFLDLAGHHKYIKTTIFGLTGYAPDLVMLLVAANRGLGTICVFMLYLIQYSS